MNAAVYVLYAKHQEQAFYRFHHHPARVLHYVRHEIFQTCGAVPSLPLCPSESMDVSCYSSACWTACCFWL